MWPAVALEERYRARYGNDTASMGRLRFTDLVVEPLDEDHAFVVGREAEAPIETVRRRPRFVGGQLHQCAAAAPGLVDDPLHHEVAEALAPDAGRHPNALDLRAPGAPPRDAGQEADLEGGHHVTVR